MSQQLITAVANHDALALVRIAGRQGEPLQAVLNPKDEHLVDALFKQLKQVFPAASQTNLRNASDESAAKKQWIAAFAENGIHSKAQLSAGMKHARASESPYWPSPGQFIAWCKRGEACNFGLPSVEELHDMVLDYAGRRGLYESAEMFPWASNAAYWMVTKLCAEMRADNLTKPELQRCCSKELAAMVKRLASGEEIPAPKAILPVRVRKPLKGADALGKIAEIRRRFNLRGC